MIVHEALPLSREHLGGHNVCGGNDIAASAADHCSLVSKSSPMDGSDVDPMLNMGGVEHRAAIHVEHRGKFDIHVQHRPMSSGVQHRC